jgi:UDP-N-acetylglucosamine--N-acetylmuramyl-(pentapeptide) pyrophosphoryl-undecaprenol N-acetylglucosamine transferase
LPPVLAELAAEHPGLYVTHQVGESQIEDAKRSYEEARLEGVEVEIVPFLDDMAGAMREAHLVVSRAGAITLAEIGAVGRAALLFPLGLAGSHQVRNAQRLVATGGGRMMRGDRIDEADVVRVMRELLADRGGLVQRARASRLLYRREAAADIANVLTEVVGDA